MAADGTFRLEEEEPLGTKRYILVWPDGSQTNAMQAEVAFWEELQAAKARIAELEGCLLRAHADRGE